MTIDLPDGLSQTIQQRRIPHQQLEGAVVSFLELYLDELAAAPEAQLWSDGAGFARRVIGNNRELLEALARL